MKRNRYKILITGGAGFIGSNLVEHFLNLDFDVICLDDLSTGFEHNIDHYFNDSRFTFIKGDIRNFSICKKAVQGCEYVLHQAALGSVPRSIKDPINTNSVNIDGFLNVLVASRDENIKRFVYAASSSTYGDSKKLPKIEDEIGKPLSPYAITKYTNELYANVFATTYGMKCIGLRYFNVFGKRQDPDSAYSAVIPLWIKKLIKHENPTVNGDGSISRDFTYIDNVVLANYLAIQTENQTAFNNVFNTAYGEHNTLNELLQYLKELLSKYDSEIMNIQINYGPKREGDIEHSHASIEKARQLLNYNPKYSLRDGLKETIQWYYENLS